MNGSNTNLKDIEVWNEESIKSRNNRMVEMLLEMFAFDNE